MKRKAMSVVISLLSIFLLTGCEVPLSLEDFFSWTDRFSIGIYQADLDPLIGLIISFLSVLVLAFGFYGLCSNMIKMSKSDFLNVFGGAYSATICLYLSLIILSIFLPVSDLFFTSLFPENLNLDWVFDNMRWELTLNPIKIVTTGWAVLFTIWIPIINSSWQIVIVVLSIISILTSLILRNGNSLKFMVLLIIGWALFPFLYYAAVDLIGVLRPDGWDLANIGSLMSIIYCVITGIIMFLCYIGMPVFGMIVTSKGRNDKESLVTRTWSSIVHNDENSDYKYPPPNYQERSETTVNRSRESRERYSSEFYNPFFEKKPGYVRDREERESSVPEFIEPDFDEDTSDHSESANEVTRDTYSFENTARVAAMVGTAAGHPELGLVVEGASLVNDLVSKTSKYETREQGFNDID